MAVVIPERKTGATKSGGLVIPQRSGATTPAPKKDTTRIPVHIPAPTPDFGTKTSTPQIRTEKDEALKKTAKGVIALGTGLGKGALSPRQTAKDLAEGFILGTPPSVAAGQTALSRIIDKVGINVGKLGELLNLPGQAAEFITQGKIRAPEMETVLFQQASKSLEAKAEENIKLAKTLREFDVPVQDERGLTERLKDPTFIFKNLIGQNAPNLLISLGVGVAAGVARVPVVLPVFLTSAALEGGFAINEAKEFLRESDDPFSLLESMSSMSRQPTNSLLIVFK